MITFGATLLLHWVTAKSPAPYTNGTPVSPLRFANVGSGSVCNWRAGNSAPGSPLGAAFSRLWPPKNSAAAKIGQDWPPSKAMLRKLTHYRKSRPPDYCSTWNSGSTFARQTLWLPPGPKDCVGCPRAACAPVLFRTEVLRLLTSSGGGSI